MNEGLAVFTSGVAAAQPQWDHLGLSTGKKGLEQKSGGFVKFYDVI